MTKSSDIGRRTCLVSFAAAAAATPLLSQGAAMTPSITFVLLHGAWHGGWCWRRVEARLAAGGHRVFSPTLTGLGDRGHLAGTSVDLSTHVADILDVLETEDLENIVLVAHSYGGVPAAMVAERAKERVKKLIFVDALLPENGKPLSALSKPAIWQAREAAAKATPADGFPPPPPEAFGITEPSDVAWVKRHLRPQPLGSYAEAPILNEPIGTGIPVAYVSCEAPILAAINPFRERAKAQAGWQFTKLAAPHDCMVTHPGETAALLVSLG